MAGSRLDDVVARMEVYADRTGLTSSRPPCRYLWTDAFAVCNYIGLARATGNAEYVDLARRLVDQVHRVLGRYRDGQYFHYLAKWMLALDQLARLTGRQDYNRWARELAATAKALTPTDDLSGLRELAGHYQGDALPFGTGHGRSPWTGWLDGRCLSSPPDGAGGGGDAGAARLPAGGRGRRLSGETRVACARGLALRVVAERRQGGCWRPFWRDRPTTGHPPAGR